MEDEKRKVLQNIASKETIGGVIWIVIAVIQFILTLVLNWLLIFMAIWNIIVGILRITSAQRVEERTDIVEQYEKSLTSIIVFIIINIFIGGLIGVIGAIYDIVVRNYVLSNKDILEGTSGSRSSSNNKYEDLEKLMKLKENGVLTDTEFEIEKRKILG